MDIRYGGLSWIYRSAGGTGKVIFPKFPLWNYTRYAIIVVYNKLNSKII